MQRIGYLWAVILISLITISSGNAGNLFPRRGEGLVAHYDRWTYTMSADIKSGLEASKATLGSQNSIEAQNGQTKVLMTISKTVQGAYVEFNMHSGDWDCFHGCDLQVKIDDSPAVTIKARPPEDQRSYLIILPQPQQFIQMLESANTTTITADTQGHPAQTMIFLTKDFHLPPPEALIGSPTP